MLGVPAVIVRPAVHADLPALGGLGVLLMSAHHTFDAARFIAPTERSGSAYASWLKARLQDPDSAVLVAERDGEVVGYAYVQVEGPDYMSLRGPAGVVHDLVVAAAERGRGVGRMLLDAAVGTLEARGVPRVVLSTAERNEAAQRLFASAGFRRTMVEMTREVRGDAV